MSILADILERARGTHRAVTIFDLDSTLFSTQQRNHTILLEFVAMVGAPQDLARAVATLGPADMGWNVIDDLKKRGFTHEPTLQRLRSFWRDRFFRDEYLRHDLPLPGAVRYVCDLYAAGATIFYLTGRDEPGMGRGTRASLSSHGFPLAGDRIHLRLKPRFEDDDLAFKRRVLLEIRAAGDVVGVFENEPANANLFAEAFPAAQVVFLETVHSPNPPPLLPTIARVRDFER
ncbi:MAG TPA: hypothetical protein VKE22_11300 [Haliangiales bacterium]|nr:hypothetical protein [Haliangiales bacterium]